MNWEAIGAIGEVLGAVGVVVTLAYLAFQIRQNTQGLRLAARQTLTTQNTDYTKLLLQPDIGDLYSRTNPTPVASLGNPLGLSGKDLATFTRLMYIAMANLENQYHAWKAGVLSDDEWSASDALVTNVYANSQATQDYWENFGRPLHESSFAEFFDSKIRQAQQSTSQNDA